MKGLRECRSVLMAIIYSIFLPLLYTIAIIMITSDTAEADNGEFCIPIHARLQSAVVSDGCDSPISICTRGEITEGGILNGVTYATILDNTPVTVQSDIEPDTTVAYPGLFYVTTKHGTLTVRDVGVIDLARGLYSEYGRVIEGTGKFYGAKGILFIYGHVPPESPEFKADIRGEICWGSNNSAPYAFTK